MSVAMRALISLPADQCCWLAAAHTRGAVGAGLFFLGERFTDRLPPEGLQALCEVTRAVGWSYGEV